MNAAPRSLKPTIARLAGGQRLSVDEARETIDVIMSGEATPAQIGGVLLALRVRGETIEEITGAALTMRAKMHRMSAPAGAMDVVGTGGDATGTLNISTATGLVVAACGVTVAKHGNRAMSSKSGAADVLAALGVNLDADYPLVQRAIDENGFGFMLAPRYHSAMRHVGPIRVELGTRTIFNLLGPISNPAGVKRLLVGVFAPEWVETVARVLAELETERAWAVHSSDGCDELTLAGSNRVAMLENGKVRTQEVYPEDAGLPRHPSAALRGGEPADNARALGDLLAGAKGAYRDTVLFNAAAALVVAGRVTDLKAGVAMAAAAIESGQAKAKLAALVAITQGRC
ncbi:MAG: anthranilate phosphoribosyltransferase [Alphaproteobacteria bacterium]|nr:anthranilate phosphoribosyltransferase [Alphaproteobacteria bacterium]